MKIETMPGDLRILPWILLLLTNLLLASCGASSTAHVANRATPAATLSPPCGAQSLYASATRAGDLLIRGDFTVEARPNMKLPDGTPLKPLQVQFESSTAGVAVPADPATNPYMQEYADGFPAGGGYRLQLCNASATQAHTIRSVAVRIDGFTADSNALNQWDESCAGGPYDSSTMHTEGDCSSSPGLACEYLHVAFPAAAGAGAQVAAAQVAFDNDGCDLSQAGPLPISLPPGAELSIILGMTAPAVAGTYAYAIGIAADSAAPTFISLPPMLFAPIAHEWTGRACQTPAMQAQIPAASVPTWYICPKA